MNADYVIGMIRFGTMGRCRVPNGIFESKIFARIYLCDCGMADLIALFHSIMGCR